MRPMEIDDNYYPQYAQLAKEVGAEAVVGVINRWQLLADSRGGQYCSTAMQLYLIDDKGTLLYDKRVGADAHAEQNGIQMAAELVGAVSPDNAKAMCKAATNQALDRLAEAWSEAKNEAAKAPPPAAAASGDAKAEPAKAEEKK